ncbi:hypothetical protein D3C77_686950 [compost metagenome]
MFLKSGISLFTASAGLLAGLVVFLEELVLAGVLALLAVEAAGLVEDESLFVVVTVSVAGFSFFLLRTGLSIRAPELAALH